jgi:hypothetical protein
MTIQTVDRSNSITGRHMRDFEARQVAATGLQKVRRLGGSVVHDIPPGTLAEVLDDVRHGQPYDYALARFLVEFHTDPDSESRRRRIDDEPDLAPNRVLNALLGAAGEHLARRWELGEVPAWTARPERYLDRPYFTNVGISKSELFQQSPPAFRRRRIYTIAEPLRCSESNLSLWTFDYVEANPEFSMQPRF